MSESQSPKIIQATQLSKYTSWLIQTGKNVEKEASHVLKTAWKVSKPEPNVLILARNV